MDHPDIELIKKENLFQGYFRVDRYTLRHRQYSGEMGPPIMREVFERGHAAVCLPYDPDRDAVVLIEQFRPGPFAKGDDNCWMLEAIAGIVEEGESPEELVHREGMEEAGCRFSALEHIFTTYPSPGACTETLEIFVGRVSSEGLGGIHGLAEEGEDIKVIVMPLDEAIERLDAGVITNANLIISLQWLAIHREALQKRWLAIK